MIIGSHNTMTYLPPSKWWMRLINWTAKCQQVDVIQQLELGVKFLDLRVRYNCFDEIVFAHGLVTYKGDVYDTLETINNWCRDHKKNVYVRILLEIRKPSKYDEESFKMFCEDILLHYKYLIFLGGERKYDWVSLYDFGNRWPVLSESYSSMPSDKSTLNDIFPKSYAKKHNRNAIKNAIGDGVIIDYVDIR